MTLTYLPLYNILQVVLWLMALILIGLWTPAQPDKLDFYVCRVQSVMVLDIIHVVLGYVKGRILTTTLQILSRIIVVWFAVRDCRIAMKLHPWANICFVLMYSSWSFAEIIRYSYYLKKDKSHRWLKWLRYNAFNLLYPVGVLAGEIPIIYLARSIYKPYDVLWVGYSIVLVSYIPGFPILFMHMVKQRKNAFIVQQ